MMTTSVFSEPPSLGGISGVTINANLPSDPTGLFHFLSDVIAQKAPQTTVELNNPSDTAVQLLQTSLTELKADNSQKQNGFSAIAVRFGKLQFPVVWDGVPGQDWGHTVITMDASDGQSLWDYYWVRSGKITVTTSTLSQDVAVGGAYYTSRDPQNPNASTITIVPTP
jgi:hypothetical protein